MTARIAILVLTALVLALPFALQREQDTAVEPDGRVIVITPHNEAIRYEFGRAFREWYEEKTGKTILVDWRVIGGTSEIVRFVESAYTAAFRDYWTRELGQQWTSEIANGFLNRRLSIDKTPADDTPVEAARRAFLASGISCGLDVFFGGGSYDFNRQARQGTLVGLDLHERHPEWFDADSLPMTFAGEAFWDPRGRWYGAVLSTFGIVYNRDSLERLGIESVPDSWRDLSDPRFIGELALADPTKSGSITKAFEMVVQVAMQARHRQLLAEGLPPEEAEAKAIPEGWLEGMRLIQLMSANARYFTDSSTKPPLDVARGDCAAGLAIDFYGRQQAEAVQVRSGSERFGFITPPAESTVSVDPIAVFRGAPNPAYARAFVEFVMSLEGQKLWNYRVGQASGPSIYNLRRSPARMELYRPEHLPRRTDPDVNDYASVGNFTYRGSWTGPLFGTLRSTIRYAFLDPHEELQGAWAAIIRARRAGRENDAAAALQVFQDLSKIDYEAATGPISATLRGDSAIEEVRLARELSLHFRSQYARAKAIAEGRLPAGFNAVGLKE